MTHSQSPSHSGPPSSFPIPGAVAPATFTRASAHAVPSPSHASTSTLNSAVSQPQSTTPNPPPAAHLPTPPAPPDPASAALPQPVPTSTIDANPATSEGVKVLPYLFDDAQLDDVLVLVVDMLVKLTEHNDSLPLHPSALTRFHSRATPNISLSAYLRRIAKYTSIEKCCVLILLVYIDRVCERLEGFTICGLTVHRFICAAILCASKALCDAFNTNEHYAKVGGISLQEINLLEKEFLQIIDWRLICTGGVLQHYYASLVRSHRDYVLAPAPEQAAGGGESEVEVEVANSSSNSNSSSGGSGGSPASSVSRDRATATMRLTGSATATPALGSSQHSSPFPISSSNSSVGASPFPAGAMQVDTDPQSAAGQLPLSRRRKDEQRSPPSPPRYSATQAMDTSNSRANDGGGGSNGYANADVGVSPAAAAVGYPGQEEAYKRTRFQPPPQQ